MRTVLANSAIKRHRGMTAMLAMLFLVLFATMAVGFYSATNTAMQTSNNDDRVARALMASESGLQYLKYELAHVNISPGTVDTDVNPHAVIDALYSSLQTQMNGTGNLGAYTISQSADHKTISIPGSSTQQVKLDSNGDTAFQAIINDEGVGEIVVAVHGYYGGTQSAGRAVQMDFSRQQHNTGIFDYAIASKGQIVMKKGTVTGPATQPAIANLMSEMTSNGAITVQGGTIGGDLNYIDGGSISVTGGTVGGTNNHTSIMANHVHDVTAPEFPTVDPTVYKQYATNTWVNKAKTQQNIRIPAGSNPKFNANDTVQGIMYVESPNTVTFNGDFKLQGFIVFESGASPTDSLAFSGNLTMSALPSGAAFDPLRTTSGIAILAPNAAVSFTGSSGGAVKGNIIVKSFSFAGAADLTVSLGTLITYNPGANSAVFNGSKTVTFLSTGATNQPSGGVSYSSYYSPVPESYVELQP